MSYGYENAAIRHLLEIERVVEAFTATKTEHRSHNGVKSVVDKILFPGYVFFAADSEWVPKPDYRSTGYFIRLLTMDDSWHLKDSDEKFVSWLLEGMDYLVCQRLTMKATE